MAYTSRIANQLLATPFDDKAAITTEVSKKLTEEKFCRNCYSHPQFEQRSQQYLTEDFVDGENDSPTNYNDINDKIHQQQIAYENFDLWLNNFDNNKIYTINGNAGTGKTTFINYMKYKETKIKWIILDINRARPYDEWMNDIRTSISNFREAQSKVYGSIMNKIWEMIFRGIDKQERYSLQLVYDNLIKLTRNYKRRYACLYPSGRKLLDEVCKVMEKKGKIILKVEKSAKLFAKYVNGYIGKEGDEIIDILNIFLLILRCLSNNTQEKYIIIFDNFERFIAKDEVYNIDVDRIRLMLTAYVQRINQNGNIHKGYFKFAMVVRDSTARMCGVRLQASDAEASNLDIGEWYNIQDIIRLKKKWYEDNGISIENTSVVEQIIGDLRICLDQTVTGLKLLIDPLFNDNKRLILDFIGSMVELPSNEKNIQIYRNLWNEDTSESRFAARSVIRGMIIEELDKKPDKLFEQLKTYSTKNRHNGIGDARKILSILYNNIYKGNQNEMSLVNVLSEFYHRNDVEKIWKNNENDSKQRISSILFYMNSYNRRENDWIQFIDLQFRRNGSNVVVEDSDKLEKLLSENLRNCTLHLMPAGRVYLMEIAASFEFFSLRYIPNYIPLFATIPTPDEIEQYYSIKELTCYKKIAGVTKYAGQCISILQKSEDRIKLFVGKANNGKYHYSRIIEKHKAYIDSFAKYIYNKYCESDKISESIRNKYRFLHKEIILQRELYNKYICNKNKN